MKKTLIIIVGILFVIGSLLFIKRHYKKIKDGNNISNKSADEIKNYILNIESYKAIAQIDIQSNKNRNTYIIKQIYNKKKMLYVQEAIEPKNIKGIKFIYNGKDLKIENTKLNLSKLYKDYPFISDSELSIMAFIEDYKNNQKSKFIEKEGKIILETSSMNNKKLYIDSKNGRIEKLEIFNVTQGTTIYILYNEIEVNNISNDETLAFSITTINKDI